MFRQDNSVGIMFHGPRAVLSTSIINGGYRNDLAGVYNHTITSSMGMTVADYVGYMGQQSAALGLDLQKVSCMGTAASMDNVAVRTERFREASVTAIVTAGIEGNAGRAGDPADYFQPGQKPGSLKPGTINIMVMIDADLADATLAQALVTCTEAKTAALQELMVGSRYSQGLATGTGTDQTILVANPQSGLYLDDAGKHSKLGELIGRSVKEAVKEALEKQNGLSGQKQLSVTRRLERFGLTWDKLYKRNGELYPSVTKADFFRSYEVLDRDERLVAAASLYAHLLDQFAWGLLPTAAVRDTGNELLAAMARHRSVAIKQIQGDSLEEFISAWEDFLLRCLQNHEKV